MERVGGETYAAKVFVQELHITVDELQRDELIVLALDGTAEVEAGVSEDRDTGGMDGWECCRGCFGTQGILYPNLPFPPTPDLCPYWTQVE